ncbi:uncharacterized protein LOC111900885 isoform X2 [Lactuca sativa]|uniref:BAH domain-containing protein n=1 Tax=Lactuca sativa TaxID=4236 RepID=A0A9R1W8T3_LACSA|nr:uncharacterized protein LOC111900885 isoform X2 [Lactuca sativa]KAJ0219303.1 hypothetical protein LSAT_V11C300141130 [Lactuca sativa]
MYGRWEGELWFHRRHMWPVPSSSKPSVAAPSNSFVLIDTNSFSKDGRTIHVGDCALFKPSHNSLPFVGLIRKLKVGKENNLTLSVNWLYRPADIKLKEGASLEAAPNEIFYSFHKDEIPAASLLHPCKVAFLPKNLELPSGISSFVCRRVYDIESKCLWWLTDQDYINERQQEVDKLLDKTRVEMYGALQTQTGGRSPKPLNGSQLKPSSDNVQNSSSSISSHAKSKKRDHGVHKSKVDDADSGQLRPEHIIKTEISKITDKGGLMDFQGVEKLIQLMRPENTDKKLDLSSRTMLVDVISVTERFDYLTRFVQLRGLSVLDEWLQEIHKGKIGDGNGSPKENDKSVEDFLFSLLRALDRLPVNLHALQTCNVGKSVNHLRSHKNSEIQKKARSLVSTWKRRVEAEMTMIETKSSTSRGGSWPSKSMMSDVSHLGNRRSTSTSQPSPLKSPQQPKVNNNNNNSGEPAAKSPADKLAATGGGGGGGGGGSSDMPSSGTKEGRSSSTTHSPNNSQSCSSDHGKTGSVYNSRNSSNGFHGSTTPGNEKGNLGKIRNFGNEKGAGHVSDVSIVDNGNNQSVVAPSEKQDQKTSGKTVNDSLQSNVEKMDTDGKDGMEGCDDAKSATVTVVLPDEHGGSSSGVTPKPGKLYEPSYSSINALVESCAKFSEASVSVSPSMGDDGGMNLLASVAAGEISRSDVACSPPLPEDSCSANVAKLRRIVQDEDNGPHVSGDSKDATFGKGEVRVGSESESLIPVAVKPEVKTGMVEVEEKSGDDKTMEKNVILPESCKVETQVNEESASWSSSDMHDEEKKKLVNNRSRNLQESQATTTSCGDADLAIKFEERDDDKKAGIHNEMDSGTSVSHENVGKHEADDPDSTVNISATTPVAETETETVVKLDFDLNEVVPSDDGNQGEVDGNQNQNHTLPSSNSPVDGNRSPFITVAAPAKGPFYPSENLSRTKPELGWKGSAATSAFRPAKPVRPLFDFDLNIGVDDSGQNNAHENSGGGLDLDLNACQEPPETVQLPPRVFPSNSNSSRGFDLNGPGVEEAININPSGGETVQFQKKGMQFLPAVPNMRVNNNMDIGVNMSSWFPPNNTYPTTITIPSIQEQSYVPSQRMLSPVLSSTPAVVPFQYSPFPFETNFPLPNSFPPVSTAYMDSSPAGGPTSAPGPGPGPICFPTQTQLVPMPYRPSYFMSLPGGSSNPGKWGGGGGGGGGGLDLNSGPGGGTGGVSKRKEPDGGWDGDRISYKHPSWQ